MRTVSIEADSERKRMVNPRKAYPVDPGLIPIFDRVSPADSRRALETAVLIELERRGMTVTYVRTPEGREVDFLARSAAGDTELLQVVSDATDVEVADPEIRALEEAGQPLPAGHPPPADVDAGRPAEGRSRRYPCPAGLRVDVELIGELHDGP